MKIGIDVRQLSLGASGGISQLTSGVCEELFALYPEDHFLVFCTPFNRSLFEYSGDNVTYHSLPISNYYQSLDRIAETEKLPVLFRCYPIEDHILKFPPRRQIFLIPDNQHETFPEFFEPEVLRSRRVAFSHALKEAGAIGTISHFARSTLLDFPETCCQDIFLMPPALQAVHGKSPGIDGLTDTERALLPDSAYFLFPANLWKHKNHLRLLQAFQRFREGASREITLILTGHPEGWSELSKQFPDLPVRHFGFVRPEFLRVLLERASALVFFSLYEGFGMPLLEAFDAGTPVLCSNTTSLPEVGADAVLSCDPTDVDAMAKLMRQILEDAVLRENLVQRGKARLGDYCWEESAHNLMAACQRVAARAGKEAKPTIAESALPLVSIVTPSYNQGRFIKRTIDSVLCQDYPHIEYMVMDGGSSDETVEILKGFGERFYWISETDRGQAHAINKGMARAKGEILAYLNSDDVLEPGAIQRVVRYFLENPECDLVYGNADYIDEYDQVTGHYKTADYSFNRLVEDCMICQPATFWRRRITDQVGDFDESLHYAMDYEYWLRIGKRGGDIRFLNEKLACSRLYAETKTLSARNKIYQEIFKVCEKHADFIHENYFQGYWHHLVYEKSNPLSLALRLWPKLYLKLAWLHHRWHHRQRYPFKKVAGWFGKNAKRRFKLVRFAIKQFNCIGNLVLAKTGSYPNLKYDGPVVGFLSDNWLEPLVSIPAKPRAPGQILHIAGISAVDTVMSILARNNMIGSFLLNAGEYRKIMFPADIVGDEMLSITFTEYTIDHANRRIVFLLQDTNVFSERDL